MPPAPPLVPPVPPPPPLPALLMEPLVRAALLEDFGHRGDLTSDLVIPADRQADVALVARQPGTLAGLGFARLALALVDPAIRLSVLCGDGQAFAAGQTIGRIEGPARGVLAAERTALNFLTHLSGVATATRGMVDRMAGHRARLVCTRKTLPGLRLAQKHAVALGGGGNHRFGLDDAILIKDNHLAYAGGIARAVAAARAGAGHLVKIEVEIDTLAQLEQVLALPVDAVLLDNMAPEDLRRAVAMNGGRMVLEASGNVTPDTVAEIAASGVDLVSAGWLTHSARNLDIGLDFEPG